MQNQYSDGNYSSSYPSYQQSYNYNYQGYGQATQYVNTSIQPGPPGEDYPQNNWAPVQGYGNQTVTPPVQSSSVIHPSEDGKKEAVAQEIQQQKTQLIKQREDYVRKVSVLKRELELLKNQKQELLSQDSPVRDLDAIIKENEKLQDEIQSKIKAIHNVIEMLSSIIKDGLKVYDLEAQLADDSPKPKSFKLEKSDSVSGFSEGKFNYVHYDPELHWCRVCDKFPKTAKEYLLHLQSKSHKDKVQESDVGDNTPWHKLPAEPELPHYEGAPKKRVPIKGLQFFISAPSWYCKLCDVWIGDLHCASHHLKSQAHFQNYANFVEQNPHWEMEWLKDREKALSLDKANTSDSDEDVFGIKKKKRRHDKRCSIEKSLLKDKKKKKHSKKRKRKSSDSSDSSSSTDSSSDDEERSDRSKSIRVAMRNVKVQNIMNEDLTGKWEMLGRLVEEHKKKEEATQKSRHGSEDRLISQWMTVSEPQEKEKMLLDNLKDRMKQKQEAEKARIAEIERKKKDKEREERELLDRKQKELKEIREKEERDRKQRELAELERIRDSGRDQVRFKASRDKFRKRDNSSSDEEHSRHSRSPDSRHYNKRHTPDRYRRGTSRHRERRSRTRSKSIDRDNYKRDRNNKHEREQNRSRDEEKIHDSTKKKPPGPPSYKKLPFIGRMPLFKNKKPDENKQEKEIKKEDYEPPRQTRFQPGNLARAFIPEPEVVCFPRLATIPPLMTPPAPPAPAVTVHPPTAPQIGDITSTKPPIPPPPPKIGTNVEQSSTEDASGITKGAEDYNKSYSESGSIMSQYYPPDRDFSMMYPQMFDFSQTSEEHNGTEQPIVESVPHAHTMPLQPPPLPPAGDADDLALLGISADDMAAQTF